jgi:hypothetical protein
MKGFCDAQAIPSSFPKLTWRKNCPDLSAFEEISFPTNRHAPRATRHHSSRDRI